MLHGQAACPHIVHERRGKQAATEASLNKRQLSHTDDAQSHPHPAALRPAWPQCRSRTFAHAPRPSAPCRDPAKARKQKEAAKKLKNIKLMVSDKDEDIFFDDVAGIGDAKARQAAQMP